MRVATTSWVRRTVTVAFALASAAAWADAASEADLHFTLGSELYRQRRFAEALDHFIASNRLVPNANVTFNIAQTYGLMQRELDAYNWYQTYLGFESLDAAGRARGEKAVAALAPRVAVLDVTTTVSGAELFIDRLDLGSVGVSPKRLAVAAGPHVVIARLPGFREARATAAAAAGSAAAVTLALERLTGTLSVTTEPAAVTVVRADTGEVLGQTPLKVTLPIGELRLALRRDGWVELERSATLRDGEETRLSATLVREAGRVAVLTVQGHPAGARVLLDGRDVGAVPLTVGDLEPGARPLSVEAPGHEPYRATALLEPGAATRATVRLVSAADDRFRFLRWVGYGLGAAALLAGGATALSAIAAKARYQAEPSAGGYRAVHAQNVAADVLMLSGAVLLVVTLVLDQWLLPAPRTEGALDVVR